MADYTSNPSSTLTTVNSRCGDVALVTSARSTSMRSGLMPVDSRNLSSAAMTAAEISCLQSRMAALVSVTVLMTMILQQVTG
jgi:hypothetical protein